MNVADCARIAGARNARSGTSPVLITRSRLNVCPKINSHSAGCTILVNSSVWSWRSFCSSTIAKAPIRMAIPRTRRQPRGARTISTCTFWSTDTAGCPPAVADRAEYGLRGVLAEIRTGVVTEDVFQRRVRGHRSFEFGGRADRLQLTVMHQRHPVAQRVGFLHVVRGEQDGHAELALHAADLRPDTVARNGIQAD